MAKQHSSNKITAAGVQPYIDRMLTGEVLRPDAEHDRQDLARIVDAIRSSAFVPVETVKASDNVTVYRIAKPDVLDYIHNRDAQRKRQQQVIQNAKNFRDARHAQRLFDRLGLDLPQEIMDILGIHEYETTPDAPEQPVIVVKRKKDAA